MIDNYDSFTYNIAQYLGELGVSLKIWRNDCFEIEDIQSLNPEAIVISPGPCTPNDAGLTLKVLERYYKQYPFFGVCLGHQSIGQFFWRKGDPRRFPDARQDFSDLSRWRQDV